MLTSDKFNADLYTQSKHRLKMKCLEDIFILLSVILEKRNLQVFQKKEHIS